MNDYAELARILANLRSEPLGDITEAELNALNVAITLLFEEAEK